MNNWTIWLILLIPVAVSILSLLFRPTKEEPRRGPRMRPHVQEGGETPRTARRSVSEIDQFLEEINRRRREAAERRRGSEPVVPVPVPEVKPVPPPPRLRPLPPPVSKPRRTEKPRQVTPVRVRERIPEAERVVIAETAAPTFPEVPGPVVPAPIPAPQPFANIMLRRPPSRALLQILPLLNSPQSLRSAILLREILDGPVARRSHRRPFR
jgi:hypothetical protein